MLSWICNQHTRCSRVQKALFEGYGMPSVQGPPFSTSYSMVEMPHGVDVFSFPHTESLKPCLQGVCGHAHNHILWSHSPHTESLKPCLQGVCVHAHNHILWSHARQVASLSKVVSEAHTLRCHTSSKHSSCPALAPPFALYPTIEASK